MSYVVSGVLFVVVLVFGPAILDYGTVPVALVVSIVMWLALQPPREPEPMITMVLPKGDHARKEVDE